jgi:hypothetical protein
VRVPWWIEADVADAKLRKLTTLFVVSWRILRSEIQGGLLKDFAQIEMKRAI